MKVSKLFVLCFALMIVLGVTVPANADSGWVYYSGTEHWYQRFDTNMLWQDAQTYAESYGGYLATITSSAENDFVWSNVNNINSTGLNQAWLGGFQPEGSAEPLGDWQWITGEAWSYTNWYHIQQPDDDLNNQDYLHYYSGSGWDDYYNDTAQAFIVETAINPIVPEPISSTLFVVGGVTLGFRRFKKKFKK